MSTPNSEWNHFSMNADTSPRKRSPRLGENRLGDSTTPTQCGTRVNVDHFSAMWPLPGAMCEAGWALYFGCTWPHCTSGNVTVGGISCAGTAGEQIPALVEMSPQKATGGG